MHIITGLIAAGLLGRNKKGPRSVVSMFRTGPVQTAHWMPGRVRFRVASLAEDGRGRTLLEEKLPTLSGVDSIEVNATTGSVLIRYREETVRPELLFSAVVRLLGLDEQVRRTPQPAIVRELRHVVESLNRVVFEQTGGLLDAWSAGLIVLGALGVKKLVTEGKASFPAGFTLVWWALNSFLGPKDR